MELIGALPRPISGRTDPRHISTSYAEGNNLNCRTFLRRLTRLTVGFSKKVENLVAALWLYLTHYNFLRIHGSLRMTPAMAAGITDHLGIAECWSFYLGRRFYGRQEDNWLWALHLLQRKRTERAHRSSLRAVQGVRTNANLRGKAQIEFQVKRHHDRNLGTSARACSSATITAARRADSVGHRDSMP